MRVGVIGLGNMGTAMANLIASNGFEVLAWEYFSEVVREVNEKHVNSRFLPGVELSPKLRATENLEEVLLGSDVVFVAIPSAYIRRTLAPFSGRVSRHVVLVNLAKGIEESTCLLASQVISSLFPDNEVLVLSGPTIANEFSRKKPTVAVLAGSKIQDLLKVAKLLDAPHFRIRFSRDKLGVELGGVLKNVYAMGWGVLEGFGVKSRNFLAAYITIALKEMAKLGSVMGARKETFLGFSGIGDLLATCLSEHSHNRRLGLLLAKGSSIGEIEQKMGNLPEGYRTLKSVLYIAEKLGVELPLARSLFELIHGRISVKEFISGVIRNFDGA